MSYTPGPWTASTRVVSCGLGFNGYGHFVKIGIHEYMVGSEQWKTGDVESEPMPGEMGIKGYVRQRLVNKISGEPEISANARLIAAAPELFEFADRIANPNKYGDPIEKKYANLRVFARSLVAKAGGEI